MIKINVFDETGYVFIRIYDEYLRIKPEDRLPVSSCYELTSSSLFYVNEMVTDVFSYYNYDFIPDLADYKDNETSYDSDRKYKEFHYIEAISDTIIKSKLDCGSTIKKYLKENIRIQLFQPSDILIEEMVKPTLTMDLSELFFKNKKPKKYIKIIENNETT